MTFEEVKKRDDYKFTIDVTPTDYEWLLKSMNYSAHEAEFHEEYGEFGPDKGVAVMEVGYIDIELNLTEYGAEYFICVNTGENGDPIYDWQSVGYVDDLFLNVADPGWKYVDVDFSAADWRKQLERDMFETLDYVVGQTQWTYNRPNEEIMKRRLA